MGVVGAVVVEELEEFGKEGVILLHNLTGRKLVERLFSKIDNGILFLEPEVECVEIAPDRQVCALDKGQDQVRESQFVQAARVGVIVFLMDAD